MKALLPWWFKLIAKMVLSRLPMGYGFWRTLGIFRHGDMDNASYVLGVFNEHVARAGLQGKLQGKTVLELGPGDSIATALVAASYGAKAILVDAGPFALLDIESYRRLASKLRDAGLSPPDLSVAKSLEDVLEACGARYLTFGLKSLSSIDAGSVDFIFSQAVLEHVPKYQFLDTMRECYRVLVPDGRASNRVDLKDHLGGSLNNLRFSEAIWESAFFVKSGFYTNRIRFPEMISLFETARFKVDVTGLKRWECLPLRRGSLAKEFTCFSDDDLRVSGFDVLLYKQV